MNRTGLWMAAGLFGLVLLIFGVAHLSAQRERRPAEPPRPPPGGFMPPGQVGRFVVAQVKGDVIILLDTATGDLYKATADDAKKYSERPKAPTFRPPGDRGRERRREAGRDRGRERGRDKDRARERPREERAKDARDWGRDKDRPPDRDKERKDRREK
jgi:hypothetical protein